MRRFKKFGDKYFQLKPRKKFKPGDNAFYTNPYFIKADAQKEAKRRRKKGQKVRIVKSQNVKWYGGDIAFFLYSDKIKENK